MQVDEYKQLKDTLHSQIQRQSEQNRAPPQPQAAAVAPESHVHEAQQDEPHKDEPAHEERHQLHQETESKVMWDSLGTLCYW